MKFFAYSGTIQLVCLRLMGKELLEALAMEGKFASEGLRAPDGDDDMLMAMEGELVESKGIGESADSIWRKVEQLDLQPRQWSILNGSGRRSRWKGCKKCSRFLTRAFLLLPQLVGRPGELILRTAVVVLTQEARVGIVPPVLLLTHRLTSFHIWRENITEMEYSYGDADNPSRLRARSKKVAGSD